MYLHIKNEFLCQGFQKLEREQDIDVTKHIITTA